MCSFSASKTLGIPCSLNWFSLLINMIRLILLVFLSRLTAIAATTSAMRVLPSTSMARIRRHSFQSIRNLQSNQCFLDTLDIYKSSSALQDASSAFDAEYEAAVEGCGGLMCTIDEDTFTATAAYARECEAAGGIIYEYNLALGCIMGDGQEVLSVLVSYLNVDHCLAPQTCDPDSIAKQSEEEANSDLGEFEEALSSGGVSASCHVDYSVNDQLGNVIVADRIEGTSMRSSSSSTVYQVTSIVVMVGSFMFF